MAPRPRGFEANTPPSVQRRRLNDDDDAAQLNERNNEEAVRNKVKPNSVAFQGVQPKSVWNAQVHPVLRFLDKFKEKSVQDFGELIESLTPLATCVATRGGKSQRAVKCLCGGDPATLLVQYRNGRNKSPVGAPCIHGLVMQFATRDATFVLMCKVTRAQGPNGEEVETAGYFCTPLGAPDAFERLRDQGFHEDGSLAISAALRSCKRTIRHDPQMNEVCPCSYPNFVELIFRNSLDLNGILDRVASEQRKERDRPIPQMILDNLKALVRGLSKERDRAIPPMILDSLKAALVRGVSFPLQENGVRDLPFEQDESSISMNSGDMLLEFLVADPVEGYIPHPDVPTKNLSFLSELDEFDMNLTSTHHLDLTFEELLAGERFL